MCDRSVGEGYRGHVHTDEGSGYIHNGVLLAETDSI